MKEKAFKEMKDIKFLAISERGWCFVVSEFANLLESGVFRCGSNWCFGSTFNERSLQVRKNTFRDLEFNIELVVVFIYMRISD